MMTPHRTLAAFVRRAAALVLLAAATAVAAAERVDILLVNGPVFTATGSPDASVVAIRGSRIVAVGGAELAGRYTASRTIDLAGRLAMPGFNDAHSHFAGRPRRFLDVSGITSIAALQAALKAKAASLPPGDWITGYGWSEDRLAQRRKPSRLDLDAATPDNPVLLDREGGHSSVANSRALALAGLTATSPDPEGGNLERLPDGSLSGVIRERRSLIADLVPRTDPAEAAADLKVRLQSQLALGITSITNASTPIADVAAIWQPLYAASAGQLPRATLQLNPNLPEAGPAGALAALDAVGARTGAGTEFLRLGAVKVFVDGGFTGPAAWTWAGYRNDPAYHGHPSNDAAALAAFARGAHARGWQLGFHAIGDRAIDTIVGVFDRMLAEAPRADHRHHLNHFTIRPRAATMATMARAGIGAITQPNFTVALEGRYQTYLPDAALASNNPIATPLAAGIRLAFSSDVIPIGPMVGLYGAVTRRGASGAVHGSQEAVDIRTALRLYTAEGAWMNFNETRLGTLAPGMAADIIVLDRNLLTTPPDKIRDTNVDLTILAGQLVYVRQATPISLPARDRSS